MVGEKLDISLEVNMSWKTVEMEIEKRGEHHLPYDGPYSADASFFFNKKLYTYGRVMTDDITVNRIPVHEEDNPQGGKTVTLGEW